MNFINKMNIGNVSYDIQAGEKVQLTFPKGAKNGTLTDEQLAPLQANYQSCIEMVNDKELYYLNDNGHTDGYLTYSHVGIENSKATIKTLTITVSAKSFVIVTTVVPTESGGGKLYRHKLKFNAYGVSGINGSGLITIVFERYSSSSTPATFDDFYNLFPSNEPVVGTSYIAAGNVICVMRCTPKVTTPSGSEYAGKIQAADIYFPLTPPTGSTVDNSGLIKGVDLTQIVETESPPAYPIKFNSDVVEDL